MLEKQKEWCQEKAKKGKEWVKDHKLGIGIAAGCMATVGLQFIKNMMFEPKDMKIQTGFNGNIKSENFVIRVAGNDRFGMETYHSPWVHYQDGLEDKERIDKAIMASINREESGEY